jgi:hypothetical protein
MSVNAGEKYYRTDNPYSYSQYNFNHLGSYILVNTNIENTISSFNQTLENFSKALEEDNNTNQIIIAPQEQELWLKTYSESTVMKMITNKCVSLSDIYKIVFDNKINVNNSRNANEISNLKNKLVGILLQLQKNNTRIFIPDLVLAINEAHQMSTIQPLAYIDDVLSSYSYTDTIIIYFHLDQLANHSDNPMAEVYNTEDEGYKTSTQTINRNIAIYRINLQAMNYSLILHTIDGKKIRINETYI